MKYPCPLPDDGTSIRLLSIKPAPDNAKQLELDLLPAETCGSVKYEALSYTWGLAPASEIIILNGEATLVRPTLFQALCALRLETHFRILWVDALCINQDDVSEKNHQVPLMPHIYANCTNVIVWLGASDDHAKQAFKAIRKNASKYPAALSHLLRRSWFRRVWVVQEIAHAPRAVVRCGDDELDWAQLYQPISTIRYIRKALYLSRAKGEPFVHPAFYPQVMDDARQTIQSGRRFGILEALRIFRPFSATMPVDKVYGIIGLLAQPSLVEVDYEKSAGHVYASIAKKVMRASRSLDVLLDSTQRTKGPLVEHLPSWAPDWSDVVAFQAATPEIEASTFQASQRTELDEGLIADESNVLQLSGVVVSTVEEVGPSPPSFDELRELYWPFGKTLPRKNATQVLRLATNYFRSGQQVVSRANGNSQDLQDQYATNETLLEAFYNSLDVNAPHADVREAKVSDLKNCLTEFCVCTVEKFNNSAASNLPWPLAILFAGPYFAVASLKLVARMPSTSRNLLAGSGQADETTQQDMFGRSATLGRTSTGLVGVFPGPFLTSPDTLATEPGDAVVLFKGSALPFVIRKAGMYWRLVGPAYIYGIMFGGAFQEEKCVPIRLL